MAAITALKHMKVGILISLVGASIVSSPSAYANTLVLQSPTPVVTGNTISVAEDGWYQFQSSNTFESLCSGTFECTVPSGSYIVINHTTQQRWEPVVVSAQAAGIARADGLTFNFPDDGWYQAQDTKDYSSVCNGQSVCTVEAGEYNVINHTTAQRWNAVMASATNATSTFLLPDNCWYQVQNLADFTSLCEGVTQCEVSAGSYNIINHSSGFRYEGISVGVSEPEAPSQPMLTFTAGNAEDVVKKVISIINEDQIDAFFENAQADLSFQGRTFFLSNTVDDIEFSQSVDLDTPYRLETNFGVGTFTDIPVRSEYTCAAGGTIYNYFQDRVFNECVVGNNTYNGVSGRRNDNMRGTIRNYPFWSFSATDAAGSTSSLTGGYSIGNLSFVVLNQRQLWRDAEFTTTLDDGAFVLSNFNVERVDRSDLSSGFDTITRVIDGVPFTLVNNSQSSSIDGSFTVEAGWTNQEPVSVTVSLSFNDTIRRLQDSSITDYTGSLDPIEPFQWQLGSIEINAADGSSITVAPTSPNDQTFSIALSNGESIGPLMWTDGYKVDCGSNTICGD